MNGSRKIHTSKILTVKPLNQNRMTTQFDNARLYLNSFCQHATYMVAAKCCLGIELQNLKAELGFTHGGKHNPKGNNQHKEVKTTDCRLDQLTWEEWLIRELNLPYQTAQKFILAGENCKLRLKKLGGQQHLIETLQKPSSELSELERLALLETIRTAVDGESLTSLLQEMKLIKQEQKSGEGGNLGRPNPDNRKSEHQEAFIFAGCDLFAQLQRARTGSKFHAALHTLPLAGNDECELGLIDILDVAKNTYEAIQEVYAARMKGSPVNNGKTLKING
jgi:hypothetical protein